MTHDTNGQDDEDFPLADHPEYTGPKAGDADMNRARDLRHLNVAAGRGQIRAAANSVPSAPGAAFGNTNPAPQPQSTEPPPSIPETSEVVVAWRAFLKSEGYDKSKSLFDLFLAGWSARDAKGE